MKTSHHVYINKNYVLRTIREAYVIANGIDVLVFPSKAKPNEAYFANTYQQLEDLLKDYDRVYSFHEVEVLGNHRGFDIVIDE